MRSRFFNTMNYGNDGAILFLRLAVAILMFFNHGYGKVERLASDDPVKFMDFLGMGPQISLTLVTFAEAACSILIALGLVFRFALLPLIITMLVVLLKVKIVEPFAEMELPLFYLSVYIFLFITGPGRYSIDNSLRAKV